MIRFTGYGVIAEKPRVGQLGRIFPCNLYENPALDRKMNDNFFDGLHELYHYAKFGEGRTTRAGCRCENMVFVCFFTGRIAPQRQTAGIKFTHRPKIRGDSLHRFTSNLAGSTGTWVRLAVQNFTSIATAHYRCFRVMRYTNRHFTYLLTLLTGGGNAAPKYQKCPLFGRVAPQERLP